MLSAGNSSIPCSTREKTRINPAMIRPPSNNAIHTAFVFIGEPMRLSAVRAIQNAGRSGLLQKDRSYDGVLADRGAGREFHASTFVCVMKCKRRVNALEVARNSSIDRPTSRAILTEQAGRYLDPGGRKWL